MAEFTGRLSNAPLVYVLTQVRFSAVLKMGEYVPAIQEHLRSDYPRYEQRQIEALELVPPAPSAAPVTNTVSRWLFKDRDDVSGFILDESSLVFHTSRYASFSEFKARLLSGAAIVQEAARIPMIERVGLRYVDLITPDDGETLDQYVSPGLMGFSIDTPDVKAYNTNKQFVNVKTKVGQLMLRFTRGQLSSPLPPDLAALAPKMRRKPKKSNVSAILDTDHFSDKGVNFNRDRLEKVVTDLHAPIAGIFKAAVTDYAVNKWR